MIEIATLGLLQKQPLHGYRLKQQLELFMGSCISVNYGTIYPLLKRLQTQGLISISSEAGETGSSRKIYQITAAGRQQWKQQMLEHPQESWVNGRSRFLIKFFFFGYLDSNERIKLLKHRLMLCQLRLENLEMEKLAADHYQTSALAYCKTVVQAEIYWLTAQLAQEET